MEATFAGLQPWTRYLDRLPADYHWHAAVWFLIGLLYLVVTLTRGSSNLAIAAAVLATFGPWVLFGYSDDLAFRLHPQLWLLPIGLIILVAEQINRVRLPPAQAEVRRQKAMSHIGGKNSREPAAPSKGERIGARSSLLGAGGWRPLAVNLRHSKEKTCLSP
jgi:hypothetical protein